MPTKTNIQNYKEDMENISKTRDKLSNGLQNEIMKIKGSVGNIIENNKEYIIHGWDDMKPTDGVEDLGNILTSNNISNGTVLDLGAGVGRNIIHLANIGLGTKNIAVEYDTGAIPLLESNIKKNTSNGESQNNIDVINTDSISFLQEQEDNSVSTIIDSGMSHYLKNPEKTEYSKQVLRTLKPGGFFTFLHFSENENSIEKSSGRTLEYLKSLFPSEEFDIIREWKEINWKDTQDQNKKLYAWTVILRKKGGENINIPNTKEEIELQKKIIDLDFFKDKKQELNDPIGEKNAPPHFGETFITHLNKAINELKLMEGQFEGIFGNNPNKVKYKDYLYKALLFHEIGKLSTKKENIEAGVNSWQSDENIGDSNEIVGGKIINKFYKELGIEDKKDAKIISCIVKNYHSFDNKNDFSKELISDLEKTQNETGIDKYDLLNLCYFVANVNNLSVVDNLFNPKNIKLTEKDPKYSKILDFKNQDEAREFMNGMLLNKVSGNKRQMQNIDEMDKKVIKLYEWFNSKGWIEGVDYKIMSHREDDKYTDPEKQISVETRLFGVGVHESKYVEFVEYCKNYMKELNEKFIPKYEGQKAGEIGYSWQGRIYVAEGNTHFETAYLSDCTDILIDSKHSKFKEFYKQKTGTDLPSASKINELLQKIYKNGSEKYKLNLDKLEQIEDELKKQDKKEESDKIWEIRRYIKGIKSYIKLIELYGKEDGFRIEEMEDSVDINKLKSEVRRHNDLTYNAPTDHIDLDEIMKETAIIIDNDLRLDKIFGENFHFSQMKTIMEEFHLLMMEELKHKYSKNNK